jgi:tetratricopeptide (TPR) repeat protein
VNPSNAPLTNSVPSPTNPAQATTEFLGLNLDAFKELVAFADVAEGFTLAIAEVNFASDGDLLVQALQNHEITQEVQFMVLDFSEQSTFSLLEALTTTLEETELAPHRKLVLLVRGLATAVGVKGDYPNFLNELNYNRDQLAKRVPHPLVLFLPDYAVNRLGQYANDLWTWKSGLFHFRTTQQMIEATQTQLSQPTALPADSRPVKQERIEQLERLLSEHSNPSDPPTRPQKACIPLALELADAYLSLADFEQARRYYHKALDWAEWEDTQRLKADALYGLGQIHRLKDDSTVKALARFEHAMELYRATGARLGEANVLKELGKVHREPKEAVRLIQQAQSIYEAIEDRYSQCRNLIDFLAEAQMAAGQKEAAIRSLHRGADLALGTEFEFYRDNALKQLEELSSDSLRSVAEAGMAGTAHPTTATKQRIFNRNYLVWFLLGLGLALLLWWLL